MANKKVGLLNVNIKTSYDGKMPNGIANVGDKEAKYEQIYYKNFEKGTCTCIIKSTRTGKVRGVGVSRCNPKDRFDLLKGLVIAEYRAKIELLKKNIKVIGKEEV